MPSTCEFQLNKINSVYYSGETIEGIIVLKTTTPKDVLGIDIIFKGEGEVSWKDNESKQNSSGVTTISAIDFKSHEIYINKSYNVYGEDTLPPGTHTFPCRIALPRSCPTSYEGCYGHIRYELTLNLIKLGRYDNIFKKTVTVIRSLDLNLIPAYKLPVVDEDISTTCSWICSSGNIISTLKSPFGGYAAGQIVRYTLSIQNQTMNDLNNYSLEFRQNIAFKAQIPHHKIRNDRKILYQKKYHISSLRLTNRVFKGDFLIPSTTPSTNDHHIISIEYELVVTVNLTACNMDINLCVPIFIGTVPLTESLGAAELVAPIESSRHILVIQPTAPVLSINGDIGNDLPPNYSDLNLPTFEEAMRSS